MTKEEFTEWVEREYCKLNSIMIIIPCDCELDFCQGWKLDLKKERREEYEICKKN